MEDSVEKNTQRNVELSNLKVPEILCGYIFGGREGGTISVNMETYTSLIPVRAEALMWF